jgi:hypothetical protein
MKNYIARIILSTSFLPLLFSFFIARQCSKTEITIYAQGCGIGYIVIFVLFSLLILLSFVVKFYNNQNYKWLFYLLVTAELSILFYFLYILFNWYL